jgi:hypothetical protein
MREERNFISMAMGGGSKSSEADAGASKELLFERTWSTDKNEGGTQIGLYNWSLMGIITGQEILPLEN